MGDKKRQQDRMTYGLIKAHQFMLMHLYKRLASELEMIPAMLSSKRIYRFFEEIVDCIPSDADDYVWQGESLSEKLAVVQIAIDTFVSCELQSWDELPLLGDETGEVEYLLSQGMGSDKTDPWLADIILCLQLLLTLKVAVRAAIHVDVTGESVKISERDIMDVREELLATFSEGLVSLVEPFVSLPHLFLAYQHVLMSWQEGIDDKLLGIASEAHAIVNQRLSELREAQRLHEICYDAKEAAELYTKGRTYVHDEIQTLIAERTARLKDVEEPTSSETEEEPTAHLRDDNASGKVKKDHTARLEAAQKPTLGKTKDKNTVPSKDARGAFSISLSIEDCLIELEKGLEEEAEYLLILGHIEMTLNPMVDYYGRKAIDEALLNHEDAPLEGADFFADEAFTSWVEDRNRHSPCNASGLSNIRSHSHKGYTHKTDTCTSSSYNYDDNYDYPESKSHTNTRENHPEGNYHTSVSNNHLSGNYHTSANYHTPENKHNAKSTASQSIPNFNARKFSIFVLDTLLSLVQGYDSIVGKSFIPYEMIRLEHAFFGEASESLGDQDAVDTVIKLLNQYQDDFIDDTITINEERVLAMLKNLKVAIKPLEYGIDELLEVEPKMTSSLMDYHRSLEGGIETIYTAYRFGSLIDRYGNQYRSLLIELDNLFRGLDDTEEECRLFSIFMITAMEIELMQVESIVNQHLAAQGREPVDLQWKFHMLCENISFYWYRCMQGTLHENIDKDINQLADIVDNIRLDVQTYLDTDDISIQEQVYEQLYRLKLFTTLYQEGMHLFFKEAYRHLYGIYEEE